MALTRPHSGPQAWPLWPHNSSWNSLLLPTAQFHGWLKFEFAFKEFIPYKMSCKTSTFWLTARFWFWWRTFILFLFISCIEIFLMQKYQSTLWLHNRPGLFGESFYLLLKCYFLWLSLYFEEVCLLLTNYKVKTKKLLNNAPQSKDKSLP